MTSPSPILPASTIGGIKFKSYVAIPQEDQDVWFRSGFYRAADFIASPEIRIPLQELLSLGDSTSLPSSIISEKSDDDRGGAFQNLPPNSLISNRFMEIYIPYTNPQSPPDTDLLSIAICLTLYQNSYLISNHEVSNKVKAAALSGFRAAVQDLTKDAELVQDQLL